jgi:hypothetical protein
MKQRFWIGMITCLAYCIDKELYDAIDYLKEQVRVLLEQQQKQNKRIRLTPQQRIRIAAKARRGFESECIKRLCLTIPVGELFYPQRQPAGIIPRMEHKNALHYLLADKQKIPYNLTSKIF